MRKFLTYIFVFTVLCFAISLVYANGIFVPPGTRANAMGGAYVAIADDVTAIYWNPAGLTQVEGKQVEISATYINTKAKSNTSFTNDYATFDIDDGSFPIYDVYASLCSAGVEPTSFQKKELDISAILPFIGFCMDMGGINLGVGFYASGGGGGKWEDSVPGPLIPTDTVTASIEAASGFTVLDLSAAKEVTPELSLGLGLNYVTMLDNAKIKKAYTDSTGALGGGYNMVVETDASGSGIEVVLGGMYKASDKVKLGLTYRSGVTISLDGTYKMTGMSDEKYRQKYAYPATIELGASYQATDSLLLGVGVTQNNYSALKTDVDYDSAIISDIDESLDWNNAMQIRIGGEYLLNEQFALRGGLYTDPCSAPTDKLSLLDTNQYNLTVITLGVGYKAGSVKLDLDYLSSMSDKPSKGTREYELPSGTFRFCANYSF